MTQHHETDIPLRDLPALLTRRMGGDPGHDPELPLQRALAAATTLADLRTLGDLALDFGARDCAGMVVDRLAALPGTGETRQDLAARIDRMWGITDLPAATAPPEGFIPGRIAYVLYSSLPFLSTGYAIRSQALARALQQAGADVQCITRPGFPWDERPDILLRPPPSGAAQCDHVDTLPYHRIAEPLFDHWPDYGAYVLAATQALIRRLRALRPAAVMAASNHACALPALRAARSLGLPMVYDMRGMWELSRAAREPEFLAGPQFCYERSVETAVARQADHVFTLSRPMREAMINRGVLPERITFLPNGCDPQSFGPTGRGTSLRQRLQIPPDVPIIGYAGSIAPHEGLEDLIEAAARIKARGHDFRLVLVGDPHGTGHAGISLEQILADLAARAGVTSRLIMMGRIPPSAVPDVMDIFDMVVIPRRSLPVTETVAPLKPVEAMAAGRAVIISSVAGMAGLVRNGETGLIFEAGNVTALADRIETLITTPDLRAALATAAREVAQRDFSWSAIARQMLGHLAAPSLFRLP